MSDDSARACPDCERSEHRLCDDTAYDADGLCECPCASAGHGAPGVGEDEP